MVGKRGGRESNCPVGNRAIPLGLLLNPPLAFCRCLFPAFPPSSHHSHTSLLPWPHSACPPAAKRKRSSKYSTPYIPIV